MPLEKLLDLLEELSRNKFWGSLKIMFKDGKIAHIEISQTLNQIEHEVLIIQKQENS